MSRLGSVAEGYVRHRAYRRDRDRQVGVARLLGTLGAEVIEADKVAHEAYEPGTVGWHEVVGAFGIESSTRMGGSTERGSAGSYLAMSRPVRD